MKKLVLIALALLVATGTSYGQQAAVPIPVGDSNNPFAVSIANLRIVTELTFGDSHEVVLVPTSACVLTGAMTFPGDTIFREGDAPRRFAVEAPCGIPANAEHVVLRITATGVRVPDWWQSDPGFYTTTPNSASDGVGAQVDGPRPPIVGVQGVGKTSQGAAVVELKKFPILGGFGRTYLGVELFVERGDAHARVEVVGCTLPRKVNSAATSPGGNSPN